MLWLRAAVLGANDGILSTSSLVLGVAAAHATHSNVWLPEWPAWWPGLCRWLLENTCLSTHRQTPNRPSSKLERAELKADDKGEHKELMAIYVARGLDPSLAKQVAQQLMAHDALGAHARDEFGISEALRARPIQAALASAGSFAVGAAMPLLVTAVVSGGRFDPSCFRNITGLPGASRRVGCIRRWRRGNCWRDTCHVLGRGSYGADCGCRVAVRNSRRSLTPDKFRGSDGPPNLGWYTAVPFPLLDRRARDRFWKPTKSTPIENV